MDNSLRNLALDRIHSIETAENEPYLENTIFDTVTFFDNLVGVTKNLHSPTEKVRFWADQEQAPYIQTKPIHKSQQLIEFLKDGSAVFEIEVVINQELRREFLGFADGIQILEPQHLVDFMKIKLEKAVHNYT